MADSFGLKIGLEGEKEFKAALAQINQSFKVLGSEMKLVESQFEKNDNSVQALTARNEVLQKSIDALPKLEKLIRVAAYARVSSGKDAMLHSLSAQITYYQNLIIAHQGWEFAGVYADEEIIYGEQY